MELNRAATVCFTGHRMIAAEKTAAVRDAAERQMRYLIARGCDTFLVGGALGFDTLAQLAALRLRSELPYLRVVMAIPCEGQDARWREKDREIYALLRKRADAEIVLSPSYTDGCMLARNRFMIDHSCACIAFFNGNPRGGTAYTVRYAAGAGVPVYNIWDRISGL